MSNILNNLGIANRARQLVFGEHLVLEGIRHNDICLVFLASDTGQNTTKKIKDKSKFYNVEVNCDFTTAEISAALGKANLKVVGLKKSGTSFLKILGK